MHPVNPNFTGREKFLDELHQSLVQATSSSKIFALVGNGGMGKTQIALQHAHRPENDFKYVWWLRSEEPATLLDDYIGIAEDLNLPGWNLRDTDQTVKAVKRWLEVECSSNWLLVFDNAQKPDDLMKYLPVAGSGQAIITSRLSVWDGMAKTLEVGVFQRDEKQDESVEFLLKRTGKNDREEATNLARELGDLPLALEQAGAYIKETGISFPDYLDRFKKDRKTLLGHGKLLNYPDTVATTWVISFEAVQKERPVAGDLLNLCAFLAPDAIPRWMLEDGAKHLTEALSSCVQNAIEFDECIAVLKRYSLINVADSLISVHRLVQAVVRDRLSIEKQRMWAESALKLVNEAFSFGQFDQETWEKCSKLSAHAFHASERAESQEVSPQETANLLNNLGRYLNNRMVLTSARSVLERALAIDEKALGPEHTCVATMANNLGLVLQDQGDLVGAKRCFERALAIDEKALGPEHDSVARDVNNLGLVLQDQGDLVGAKRCCERALKINVKAFGLEHTQVAINVNNLGLVLKDLGDLEGAKKCCEEALKIDEKALGPKHTRVAIDVNNLGLLLKYLGDLAGAKGCFERALEIDEKAFGQEHPRVATRVNNLALVLKDLGDLKGAKRCCERAIKIDEKAFGPEHTRVATMATNLGSVLQEQGDLEGAKSCFERALKIDEKALGPDHTSVARDVNNLGSVLKAQGDLEGAKRCFERALKIFEKRLGKDHPNAVLVRNNLKSLQENS
ncbi:MAG: FxSxx-COOH system tetratricopeptide repeat protein [Methanothrix sp.]|nr:FxSxx-COOH system tetratricopeptide repeat protein [Methanothrix sp.]